MNSVLKILEKISTVNEVLIISLEEKIDQKEDLLRFKMIYAIFLTTLKNGAILPLNTQDSIIEILVQLHVDLTNIEYHIHNMKELVNIGMKRYGDQLQHLE